MCRFWKRRDKDVPYEKVLSLLDEAYKLGARRFFDMIIITSSQFG
jgi:hypothetical protein